MRILKIVALFLLVAVIAFVAHTLVSTGFFRTIKPKLKGNILEKIPLKGAEDITISYIDSIVFISATNRIVYPPKEEEKGGLYLMDLKAKTFEPISLTAFFNKPFAPHGISFFKKDSIYHIMAVNHTIEGHSIEVFELYHRKNDLVMLDENRFYFTNDHGYTKGLGKLMEEHVGLSLSNVVYFDGVDYKVVAKGIAYANGINFNANRNLLFVASPRKFLVKVYHTNPDYSLTFIEDIPCGTGVDNIELDEKGNLWIGGHPSLLGFQAYSKGKKAIAPSEVIKINYRGTCDYNIEQIYVEDGKEMSGASVAATFGNLIFVGNVMDDEFLVLER